MMASIPLHNEYAGQTLERGMNQDALAEIEALESAGDFENPRYMDLLVPHHYVGHILRMPADAWPDPLQRTFRHLNPDIYVPMRGRASSARAASCSTGIARQTSVATRCRRW
jgi:proline iminopeptidase